jgi:hypothetical protein
VAERRSSPVVVAAERWWWWSFNDAQPVRCAVGELGDLVSDLSAVLEAQQLAERLNCTLLTADRSLAAAPTVSCPVDVMHP